MLYNNFYDTLMLTNIKNTLFFLPFSFKNVRKSEIKNDFFVNFFFYKKIFFIIIFFLFNF